MEKLPLESKPGEAGPVGTLEPLVRALRAAAEIPRIAVLDWASRAAKAVTVGWPQGSAAVALQVLDSQGSPTQVAFGGARGSESLFPAETPESFHCLPCINIWGTERPTYTPVGIQPRDQDSCMCVSSYQVTGKLSATVALRLADTESCPMLRESIDLVAASLAGHARSWIGQSPQIEWFSAAESGVAMLALEGLQESEIARRLFRSAHTIHDHLKEIYRKSGATSRAHLVALAYSPRARGVGVMPPETLPESSAAQTRQSRISRQPRMPSRTEHRPGPQVPISVPSV